MLNLPASIRLITNPKSIHTAQPLWLTVRGPFYKKIARDRLFYLHVGFIDTHRAPGGFGNEKKYRTVPDIIYHPDDVIVPLFLPDLPEVRADLADYYQAISRFDHGVGILLDVLEESGRADETLVILTTDHAMPFPGIKASFFRQRSSLLLYCLSSVRD